jgi:hypothetical protein
MSEFYKKRADWWDRAIHNTLWFFVKITAILADWVLHHALEFGSRSISRVAQPRGLGCRGYLLPRM